MKKSILHDKSQIKMQILIHKSKTKVYFEKKEKINNIFGGYKSFLTKKPHQCFFISCLFL